MFYRAKNGVLHLDGTDMNYITFGKGEQAFLMIPGLGDGLKNVKGMAIPFALLYPDFAKKYKVYVFSRKNRLPEGYSTRDMAADCAKAMELLGIEKADVLGVSQGGMISQYLAIDYPHLVRKLVLAVTCGKKNPFISACVNRWMEMAQNGQNKEQMIDILESMYSEAYVKVARPFCGLVSKLTMPKDISRYLIMAEACLSHNAYDVLDKISCPTLILGGAKDLVVGAEASYELAEKIPGSRLHIYEEYGHGAYEEAKDFNDRVLAFFHEE